MPVIFKHRHQVPQVYVGDAARDFEPDWQQVGIVANLHVVARHGLPDRIGLPTLKGLDFKGPQKSVFGCYVLVLHERYLAYVV